MIPPRLRSREGKLGEERRGREREREDQFRVVLQGVLEHLLVALLVLRDLHRLNVSVGLQTGLNRSEAGVPHLRRNTINHEREGSGGGRAGRYREKDSSDRDDVPGAAEASSFPPTIVIRASRAQRGEGTYRQWMVMERGMWPTGTWSGSSCTRISWYFMNRDPRVWMCSCPAELLS
jgi:hypothetical protein